MKINESSASKVIQLLFSGKCLGVQKKYNTQPRFLFKNSNKVSPGTISSSMLCTDQVPMQLNAEISMNMIHWEKYVLLYNQKCKNSLKIMNLYIPNNEAKK